MTRMRELAVRISKISATQIRTKTIKLIQTLTNKERSLKYNNRWCKSNNQVWSTSNKLWFISNRSKPIRFRSRWFNSQSISSNHKLCKVSPWFKLNYLLSKIKCSKVVKESLKVVTKKLDSLEWFPIL